VELFGNDIRKANKNLTISLMFEMIWQLRTDLLKTKMFMYENQSTGFKIIEEKLLYEWYRWKLKERSGMNLVEDILELENFSFR
jgi:hypothetical protein